ncbi:MAG: magnesium transporter [Chloroflexi bacterium]|nr:magnesium transporter [Chloroflexota bacterium]
MSEGDVMPGTAAPDADLGPPRAISLDEVAEIAGEVRELIEAGDEHSAWERLRILHPADMALILAGLPRASTAALLRVMSPESVVWLLGQMNPVEAGRLGRRLGARMLSLALRPLRPQQALATLARLPTLPLRELRELLGDPAGEDAAPAPPPDTAASIMTDRFPAVGIAGQAGAARASLRELGDDRHHYARVLVVDDAGRLAGQIAMADLALAEPDTPVAELAIPIVATASLDTPAEECTRLQRHYGLAQLPVLDGEQPVGVILAGSLLSAAVEQDTRQMLQVASVGGETIDGPLSASIRTRLPWLTVNLATTFLAAATIALFESTLAQVVVLAAFLPVVAGQGGIGGTQTLTLIVRSIALGELVGVRARRLLTREATLGLLHGVWLGVLVAVIAILWKQNVGLGLVLAVAMLGNMVIAGFVGAAVPLFLRRAGIDPAVASAVIVTTATDVFGFLLFLGIASAAIELIT